ncbi:hypothetical protein RCL1_005599 [Eukaryota sp. TZLM3-RCL]
MTTCLLPGCTLRSSSFSKIQDFANGGQGSISLVSDSSGNTFCKKVILKGNNFSEKEIEFVKAAIKSPYLVESFHCFESEDTFAIIMEYCSGGNLSSLIYSTSGHPRKLLTNQDIWRLFLQILVGLNTLHLNGYIHRDIKPLNVLITNGSSPYNCKLCDFGVSRFSENTVIDTFVGTPAYIAPEVASRCPYTYMADYWSLGVLLYEMTEGRVPFEVKYVNTVDYSQELWFSSNNQFTDIIRGLLNIVPENRFNFESLLKVKDVRRGYLCNIGPLPISLMSAEVPLEIIQFIERKFSVFYQTISTLEAKNMDLSRRVDSLEEENKSLRLLLNKSFEQSNGKLISIRSELMENFNNVSSDVEMLRKETVALSNTIRPTLSGSGEAQSCDGSSESNARQAELLFQQAVESLKSCRSNNEIYVPLFEKAAALGCSKSMYNLGWYYRNVVSNDHKALEWYTKASNFNESWSLNAIGMFHQTGMAGLPVSFPKAIEFYKKAIDLGDPWAMGNLGNIYMSGRGSSQDLTTAEVLLKKASDAGAPVGMYCYGRFLSEFKGLTIAGRDLMQKSGVEFGPNVINRGPQLL